MIWDLYCSCYISVERDLGVSAAQSSCLQNNSQLVASGGQVWSEDKRSWGVHNAGQRSEGKNLEREFVRQKEALCATRLQLFPATPLIHSGAMGTTLCLSFSSAASFAKRVLQGVSGILWDTWCYFQQGGPGSGSVPSGLALPAQKFLLRTTAT